MKNKRKKKKSPFPPNISVNYYTDPIYSSESNYGYDEETTPDEETASDARGQKEKQVRPEPVESWGWIDNAD